MIAMGGLWRSATQRHAARAIGHLSGNAQCQKEIGAAGGLRPLIKCGYSRSPELQQLVVRAVANAECRRLFGTNHPHIPTLYPESAQTRHARLRDMHTNRVPRVLYNQWLT